MGPMKGPADNMNENTDNDQNMPHPHGPLRDQIDRWEEMSFHCDHCGADATGSQLGSGEIHDTFFEKTCPRCGEMVAMITRPHISELLTNLDRIPGERHAEILAFAESCRQWHAAKLHREEQLPDIAADHLVLVWDEDHATSEIEVRCGEREIYRGPTSWEYYDYFIEACKVLRRKYGDRLHDVVPTERTFQGLWGDRLSAPCKVDEMRRRPRENSRIGNWTKHPVPPGDSWEAYTG